jgi:hypothetical protein
MEFRLLTQTREEIDVEVLKGMLANAGVAVRVDSKFTQPSKYSRPDLFGVYVAESQWEEAQKVLAEFHPYAPKAAGSAARLHKTYVIAFFAALLGMAAWYLGKFLKDIFNSNL